MFFQFGSRNSSILDYEGNGHFVQGREGRRELTDYLSKIEPEILDKWFEAHNAVVDGVFFASDFRPSHVISLLLTIDRSTVDTMNPDGRSATI